MIVGTAGHIDHGKTSLVRALTGVDTDRLKEEKARGISIELGFAYLPAPDGDVIGFIDAPGHEKFIHTMLAGASGVDFALLIVAADDGVMPQTSEHVAILDMLGVRRGVVALTKSDLVSPEQLSEVSIDIARLLARTVLAGSDVIPVSSVTGEGIDDLRERLFDAARATSTKPADGRFRLAVDRSFTLAGIGTVVTGTVLSGAITVQDKGLISPSGLEARVRSIHAQNRASERGVAGQRCALNLAGDGITKEAIARGDMIVDPALHAPTDRIDVTLRHLSSESKPLAQWTPVRFHHAAVEVGARIVLLGDEPIAPGSEAFAQLVLERPVCAAVGDRFVIRDTTAQRTIGGGALIDLRAPARKRRTPERLAQLRASALREPSQALAALLTCAPFAVDLTGFARDRALSSMQIESIVERLEVISETVEGRDIALSLAIWRSFVANLHAVLGRFHSDNPDLPGVGLERLKLQLEPRLPAPVFRAFLRRLAKDATIALDGAWVRLAGHETRLAPEDEKIWARIEPLLSGDERFRPPRVRDIANLLAAHEADIRRILKILSRMGRVDEIAHDHFFRRPTVAEMVDIIARIAAGAEGGQFTAAQFRDRVESGRKVAIQILEFFDRHGVTLRRGDLRRVNRHRLDLFRVVVGDENTTVHGRDASPVGRPDFKSGKGRETVLGGFDSLSLPPNSASPKVA